MSESNQYSFVARMLHWLIAGLIVCQYVLAELAEKAEQSKALAQQLALLSNHKSIGMTIVMLAVLRLVWRFFNKPPALPTTLASWQRRAAKLTHWAFYGLIFAIPVSGWLMSSASAYSVSWFNLFVFPDLVSPSEVLADTMHEVHESLVKLLFLVAVVHIVAAVKHFIFDKDDVLQRMASVSGWLVFFASIGIGVLVFGRIAAAPERQLVTASASNLTANPLTESVAAKTITPAPAPLAAPPNAVAMKPTANPVESHVDAATRPPVDLPLWNIDYQRSFIEFSGDQAGAPFKAEWQNWNAAIKLAVERLGNSSFDVTIETNSVFSNDEIRDQTIMDADFFDAAHYPIARFAAQDFAVNADGGFYANALLTIKGISHPVLFKFSIQESAKKIILTGTATLDRFAWNIGIGEWTDTAWIGKEVDVSVRLVAHN